MGRYVSGLSRIRGMGRIAAGVAAYALIVNAILTSALAASIPPDQYKSSFELCVASRALTGSAATTAADADSSGNAAMPMHCPLCTPHHTAIDVPEAPVLAVRVAVTNPLSFPAHEPFLALARIIFHHARGPPNLT